MNHDAVLRLCAAMLLSSALCAVAAPTYRVTLIEPPPGTLAIEGKFINDDGLIAGDVYLDTGLPGDVRVFRWSPSKGYEIALAPNPDIHNLSINIDGAGNVQGGRDRQYEAFRVFNWALDGTITRFGWGYPASGNVNGDVAAFTLQGGPRVWTFDGRELVPEVRFSTSGGLTLNDARVVAGLAERPDGTSPLGGEATLWDERRGTHYLGTPAGHPNMRTLPTSISNRGVVIGNGFDFVEGGLNEALRYTAASGFEFLGQIAGCGGHGASAQNESGAIVGQSVAIEERHGCGWIWTRQAGIRLLYDLIDPADPLRDQILFQYPSSINVHGQIIGRGRLGNTGVTFLLTPIQDGR